MRINKVAAVATLAATLLGFGAVGAKALVDVDAAVVAIADVEAVLDELDLELVDILALVEDVEDGVDGLLEEVQELEVADIVEAALDASVVVTATVVADVEADAEALVDLLDEIDADDLLGLVVEFAEEAGAEVLETADEVVDTVEDLELLDVDAAAAIIAFVELF